VEQFDRGADAPRWFSAIEVVVQLKRGTRRLASLYKNIKRFGLTPLDRRSAALQVLEK